MPNIIVFVKMPSTVRRLSPLLLIILSLSFFACHALADGYQEGLKRARKQNKPIILYFFSKHCPYCEMIERDTFGDKEIQPTMKADTVFIPIDVEIQPKLAATYSVRGYPTTWLLEPSGKRIAAVPGYIPKKEFKKILAYLKGRHYTTMTVWAFLRATP